MARFHPIPEAAFSHAEPHIRRISTADLWMALRKGMDDFKAMPTHAFFIAVIYPVLGLVIAGIAFGKNVIPLVFPLMAGFALLGPVAAIGLYELSRRREQGEELTWTATARILHPTRIGSIGIVGMLLLIIFLVWLLTAQALYTALFGEGVPQSIETFLFDIFTTGRGWLLIVVGNAIGFLFSLLVLAISVVSFPMLVDRDVTAAIAIQTSVRAFGENFRTMLLWGFIVAALLVIGFIPVFFGLAVVLPVLGHATWHLYRRVVEA